jgi:hypothetical protein
VGADEVPAGAARDDRELDVPRLGDTVYDLVDGSVAADRNQERRALGDRTARQLGEVAGPLREQRLAAQAALGCEVGDLRPALPRRAVVGRRVDQEDGLANGRSRPS